MPATPPCDARARNTSGWTHFSWGIGAGLGGTTGFAINPARDLGPRIAHAILPIPGKGGSDFAYGFTVPVLGGLIGGALAGLFIRVAHL